MKKIFNTIIILLVVILTILTITWADSTGVWHRAEDIQGGVFGGDEQAGTTDYTFINPVKFNDTIKVDVIKSNNANGNVIIQLG